MSTTSTPAPDVGFTPQEFRVFHLLKSTRVPKEIAANLGVAPKTAWFHIRHVYRKAGVTGGRVEFWKKFGFEPGD